MSSVHGEVLTKRVRCGGESVVSPGEVLLPGLSSQQRPSRAPHAWCGWQCACSRLAPLQLSCTNSFSAPSTCRQHVQCMCSGYVHALHYRTRSTRHTAHAAHTARTAPSTLSTTQASQQNGAYVHTMHVHVHVYLLVGAAVRAHGKHLDDQLLEKLDDRRVAQVVAPLLQRDRQ